MEPSSVHALLSPLALHDNVCCQDKGHGNAKFMNSTMSEAINQALAFSGKCTN